MIHDGHDDASVTKCHQDDDDDDYYFDHDNIGYDNIGYDNVDYDAKGVRLVSRLGSTMLR